MGGQRINRISFISSAVIPAVSALEGINILPNTPSFPSTQENVGTIRAVPVGAGPLACRLAIIHIRLRSAATLSASASVSVKPPNPVIPAPRDAPSFDIAGEERLLRDIVDMALAQGVYITRGQELVEAPPTTRLAITTALLRKECKRTAGVIKFGVANVLAKRK
ncbi:hypothetical protein EDB89DRAFT_1854631 [Lactarius sanguifluus]|nr:hypothetical protein EDB89DRAFT_1854631 [Lactarius sanguifluus]